MPAWPRQQSRAPDRLLAGADAFALFRHPSRHRRVRVRRDDSRRTHVCVRPRPGARGGRLPHRLIVRDKRTRLQLRRRLLAGRRPGRQDAEAHIPAGTGYHENEHFHPGDSDYPLHQLAGVRTALPDLLRPVVSRVWRDLRSQGRAVDHLPDRNRFRAVSAGLRQPAAVAEGDRRQRHHEQHLHGCCEPHWHGGWHHLLWEQLHQRPLGNVLAQAPRANLPSWWQTWIWAYASDGASYFPFSASASHGLTA